MNATSKYYPEGNGDIYHHRYRKNHLESPEHEIESQIFPKRQRNKRNSFAEANNLLRKLWGNWSGVLQSGNNTNNDHVLETLKEDPIEDLNANKFVNLYFFVHIYSIF